MPFTTDRAGIIHFAGRHRLSPALRDGAPALVAPGDAGERCGWAPFFAAMRARGVVAAFEPDDPASFRLVPRAAAAGRAAWDRARLRGAFAEARRFLAALRGRFPRA